MLDDLLDFGQAVFNTLLIVGLTLLALYLLVGTLMYVLTTLFTWITL